MAVVMLRTVFSLLSPGGTGARLSILIFHRVLSSRDALFPGEPDVGRFDDILGWIGRWLRVLPLEEAVRRLDDGSLPPAAAAITFDDGYADNFTNALPVLRKHRMPATFFVASSFLDGGRMWNDTLIESVRLAEDGPYDLGSAGLGVVTLSGAATSRRQLIDALLQPTKYLAPAERDAVVEDVRRTFHAPLVEPLMMSSDQLRRLRDAGMGIGAHTRTHPILARTPDETARLEISAGKRDLERLLDQEVTLFAYPNGKPKTDYDDKHVAMVRDAGFKAAVSTAPGISTAGTDRLQLPRFSPWDRDRLRYAVRLLGNLRGTRGRS